MTNAEMLNLLMKRLGGRSAPILRTQVLIELNEQIRQKEQGDLLPWFMQDVWTTTTQANVVSRDLPTDYIREDDTTIPEIRDPNEGWAQIIKVPYNRLRAETANALPAFPQGYSVYGEKVYFGPVPDAVYDFRLPYFKRTETVLDNSSQITNKWLLNFFNYITLETIETVARLHTRDYEIIRVIEPELRDARVQFMRAVEAREHAGQSYLLTDEEN